MRGDEVNCSVAWDGKSYARARGTSRVLASEADRLARSLSAKSNTLPKMSLESFGLAAKCVLAQDTQPAKIRGSPLSKLEKRAIISKHKQHRGRRRRTTSSYLVQFSAFTLGPQAPSYSSHQLFKQSAEKSQPDKDRRFLITGYLT